MKLGFWSIAQEDPNQIALWTPDGTGISRGELLANANRLTHALRAQGLVAGDTIAAVLPNGVELFEVYLAAMQAGCYLTPINWHLAGKEIEFIISDSDSKFVFVTDRIADLVGEMDVPDARLVAVGDIPGLPNYRKMLEDQPEQNPTDRTAGAVMTYTSGTTGKPRGVRRPLVPADPEAVATQYASFLALFGIEPRDGVHLVSSPMYHTAVMNFATNFLHYGHELVVMDKWSAEETLELIQAHRVTSSHMVPTHFRRLLALDAKTRADFDPSSLKHVIHSAAPCPVEVKRAMLQWWGPVIFEYYAASEGGGTLATPEDWLKHPGTVGRAWPISEIQIRNDDGEQQPAKGVGTVYMAMGDHRFQYHKDQKKTDDAWKDGLFTVGDVGYLDEDGFLFLCDRKVDMIISGGVNIYPAEIESALISHPQVVDIAVFGVPDDDWGEQVKAVVQLKAGPPSEAVTDSIRDFAETQLAGYKIPRTFDFMDELPRDPSGKLYKRKLRDPYWVGRTRSI